MLIIGQEWPEVSNVDLTNLSFSLGCSKEKYANISFDNRASLDLRKLLPSTLPTLAMNLEALMNTNILTSTQKSLIDKFTSNTSVGIRLELIDKHWTTFPSGEKILDDMLVTKPLKALNGQALKDFTLSLSKYQAREWNDSVNYARKTLEEYLRIKLQNKKGFQANIEELGKKLKENESPEHWRNYIISQLKRLDTIFNENSKHNSKVDGESETEMLIYQTGLIINFLEKNVPEIK